MPSPFKLAQASSIVISNWTFFDSGTGATFDAPITGTMVIRLWGPGMQGDSSNAGDGGGAGGFSEKTVSVTVGDTFTYTVAAANSGLASTVTCASPTVSMTANGGVGVTGGTASGGDTNTTGGNGTTHSTSTGGNGGSPGSGVVNGPAKQGGAGGAGGGKNSDGVPGFGGPGAGGGGPGKSSGSPGSGTGGRVVFIWYP